MGFHGLVDLPSDLPTDATVPSGAGGSSRPDVDGPRIDGYRIDRLLGAGGHAQVWLGRDEAGDQVALKVLAAGAGVREAVVLRRLTHPHLVSVRAEAATADGCPVLVLDYLPGGSLTQLVSARGALDPGEVVTVLTPLAEALGFLHGRGAVHGDVSPSNVLFGEDGRPMLCDLGASVVRGVESREQGTEGFTVDAGQGAPADVFGLGGLGWFALTGRAPQPAAVRPPLAVLCPQAPLALTSLIERCLSADPQGRPTAPEVAVEAFDSEPPQPVRLVAPQGVDAAQAVTHRLRRRSEETTDLTLETILMGAIPPDQPASTLNGRPEGHRGIDRTRLRRMPAEPRRRRPPRGVVVAAVVACGLLAGAGAGAVWMKGRDVDIRAGSKPTDSGHTSGDAQPQESAQADADPSEPEPSVAPTGSAPSEPAESEPSSPGGGGDSSDPAGAVVEPVAALQQLSDLRAQAYGSGDKANLEKVNVPGSPALQADLSAWQRMHEQGLQLRGVTFELADATVQASDETSATVEVTTTTGEYELVRDGSVVDRVARGEPRRVVLHLVHGGGGWQIERIG